MDSIFSQNIQIRKSRSRCYSSMNYQEYQDFFGTPPKMPNAPQSKPMQDPEDIPQLTLEDQANAVREPLKIRQIRKIKYKIDTIPEIQASEDNSIGAFQSPKKNYEFLMVRANSRLQEMGQQLQTISITARKRNRPRSYSENSPLNHRIKIIDFLKDHGNKQLVFELRGRKMVKIQ